MPTPLIATGVIAATSVCFGLVPWFGRVLLEAGLSPEAVALYRFSPALPLALWFLPWRRTALRPALALAGAGLASGIGWTTYLNAIGEVPIASAGVVYMSYPLFVVILARLLFGQRISARAAVGAALVLAGAFIVNAPGALSATQWLALLSSVPAPIGFALVVVLLASIRHGLSTFERWSALAVGHVAGLLPAALLSSGGALLPGSAVGWAWIAGLALVTATLPQLLYTLAAHHVSPSRAAAAGSAELPTMMAIGLLVFGESIGIHEGVGALLVIAAIGVTPAITTAPRRLPRSLASATSGGS